MSGKVYRNRRDSLQPETWETTFPYNRDEMKNVTVSAEEEGFIPLGGLDDPNGMDVDSDSWFRTETAEAVQLRNHSRRRK